MTEGDVGRVLIVGGGIAGMTLAVALGRRDVEVEIAEITPEWSVSGIGIALTGPALRAIREVGLLDALVREGFGVSEVADFDVDGAPRAVVELPRLTGPEYPATLGIMRPAVHRILRRAVEGAGVAVRLGVTAEAIDSGRDGVDVRFTDGSAASYDLLVGADGVHSRIRRLLLGDEAKARFTGQAVWRATLPRPPEVTSFCQFFGPRSKTGFNPVSQELMYMFLVENTDDPGRRSRDSLPARMREMLADFGGAAAEAREQITDPDQIVQRPIEAILLSPPWHRGRAILIGDAAHAAPPHLASGGGMAIEDAVVLGEMLETGGELEETLAAFAERRYERCRIVVENSLQLGEWERRPGDPGADPAGLMNESYAALAQAY